MRSNLCRWLLLVLAASLPQFGFAAKASPSVAAVLDLYQDYEVPTKPLPAGKAKPPVMQAPKAELLRRFTPELAELILHEQRCAKAHHDACGLRVDPMWDSDTPGAAYVQVHGNDDPGEVSVTLTRPVSGERVQLTYRLVSTSAGWRIDDIIGASGTSLRTILKISDD